MTASRKSKIYFFFDKKVTLEKRRALKKFLTSIFKKEQKNLGWVNFIFCSDDYLRSINKRYLRHNYYTDIVTFGLSGKTEPLRGEIYISVDRVKENATLFGISLKKELHRVIIHGVLHLCGYRDKTRGQKKQMTALEDYYLASYL
jgi:rRNA maturation RNase YbeY